MVLVTKFSVYFSSIFNMLKLTPGKKFRVVGFNKACDRVYRHRLLAMGFMLGSVFKVLRVAPLGDPLEVEIKGYLLSLRSNECQVMQLELVNE